MAEPLTTTTPTTEHTHSPDTPEESRDLAQLLTLPKPVRQCCEVTSFFVVTLIFVVDMATDVWTMTIFGLRHHIAFLGMGLFSLTFCGVACTAIYALQMRTEGTQRTPVMYGCMLLNFPLQLGIASHRLLYSLKKCDQCSIRPNEQARAPSTQEWIFTKLKLVHGMFQSAPQLMINMLHMLVYGNVHFIQYISALVSFASLVSGAVFHEKVRKERLRNNKVGLPAMVCISLYKFFILGARTLALTSFIYYFGVWLGALLLPHFVVLMAFFTYLYRQIWKVQYYKIVLHSLFCLLAYFPIHNEYRPEGEIVMYYLLFTIENVLMVCLPYGHEPAHKISPVYKAGTKYHIAITMTVLVSTVLGLVFMTIYYFLFHKSKHTIRHTHLSWLARLCEWANKSNVIPDLGRSQNSDVRLYVDDGELGAKLPGEQDRLTELPVESGSPNYRPKTSESGSSFRPILSEDVDQSLLEDDDDDAVKYGEPSLALCAGGAGGGGPSLELLSPDDEAEVKETARTTANRPSVLEGDDEDSDQDPDIDRRPIHIVV